MVAPASPCENHSVRNEALNIRRPKLQGVRRFGTVRRFKEEKGYGRITADDGEVPFVHFSAIELDGYRALIAGQRVSFVWNGGTERPATRPHRWGIHVITTEEFP
jgi:CspA family cold shock protein